MSIDFVPKSNPIKSFCYFLLLQKVESPLPCHCEIFAENRSNPFFDLWIASAFATPRNDEMLESSLLELLVARSNPKFK